MKYGELDKIEQLRLKDLGNRANTVSALFDRVVQEQTEYERKKDEWFAELRAKYNVPDNIDIFINDKFEIIEDENKEEQE